MSLGFLFLYIAFNSSQNIQSLILDEDGFGKLGFYSLGVMAVFQGLGSLMSTGIVNKVGVKWSMLIGAFLNSTWVMQSIIPALKHENPTSTLFIYSAPFYYTLNILISAVSGFFGSLLWVAEGKYISECASEDTKGFYFSWFWFFYNASQVVGNLIAAVILGNFNQVSYFSIMTVTAFLASASFGFLRKPRRKVAED